MPPITRLLLVILLAISYSTFGEEIPASISQWSPTSKKLTQDELLAANNIGTTWEVFLEGEEVKIRPYDSSTEADASLKLRDGRLISENRGEFGAAVYWESNDGKKSKISEHPIEQFIQLDARVFAISGSIPGDIGEVVELNRTPGGWSVSRLAELKDTPIKVIKESETSLLVLTYSSLSRVWLKGKTEIIVPKGEWKGLSPRSLIMDGKGFAYVGFNQRVAKVELKTGKVIYLVPYPEIFADDLKRNKNLER